MMKSLINKAALTVFLFLLLAGSVFASHFKGGQITYEALGNNQYKVISKSYWRWNAVSSVSLQIPGGSWVQSPQIIADTMLPDNITKERHQEGIVQYTTSGSKTISYSSAARIAGGSNFSQSSFGLSTVIVHNPPLINSSPTFSGTAIFNFGNQSSISFNLNASDPDGDSLAYSFATPVGVSSTLYNGMNLSIDASGQVSWTNPSNGIWLFNVRIDEFKNGTATGAYVFRDFMIYVDNTINNSAPVISPITSPQIAFAGQQFQLSVTASDADAGDVVNLTANGSPLSLGAAFPPVSGNPVTGTFDWTPNAVSAINSPYTMQFVAADNNPTFPLSDQKQVSIIVDNIPIAQNSNPSTNEDTPVSITLQGSDFDSDVLSFTIFSGVSNGSLGSLTLLNDSTGSVLYTPNQDFYGTDYFTFKVNDGYTSSNAGTVTITVNPVPDAPVVGNSNVTTNENQSKNLGLNASDADGDSLIFSIVAQPQNGTLGSITPINKTTSEVLYTPNPGFVGTDTFDFQATDGVLNSGSGAIGITVNSVPTVTDLFETIPYETSKTLSLSGTDADNDQLTFGILTPPANGTLGSVNSTGLFTAEISYTPNNIFSGPDSFQFVANDGFTNSNTAWAFLTVEPPNDPPFLDFTNDFGFSNSFVHPDTGSSQSAFSFAIDYFDVNGDLPSPGYPLLRMDFENNGAFNDPNDLSFTLLEADPTDVNVADGKRYIFFSTGGIPPSPNWSYRLESQDSFGASAPSKQETPTVSDDFLDVKIFADDIVFSDLNPDVGDLVTISATIHNSSDFDANNFVVSLYEEDTLINSIVVPNLSAQNQTTVSWVHTYTAEQFYPMKVVVDQTNVLVEDNELNNFAIRPVLVGNYTIPGNINVVASLTPSITYGNEIVRLSGNAQYSGVFGTNFSVSGANVTFQLVETGATFSGTTNNAGDFTFFFTASLVPGTYTIIGSVTDLTLNETFGPLSLTILSQPADPDLVCNVSLSNYSPLVNTPVNGTATVTNIGDDVSGPFSFRYYTAQGNITTQVISNLNPGGSQTFNFVQTYTTVGSNFINGYADYSGLVFEKNESNNTNYHSVNVLSDKPDLTPSNNNIYGSHNVNSPYPFNIRVQNQSGVSSGSFDVKVYDSFGAAQTLIHTETVQNLSAGSQTFVAFSYTFPTVGTHGVVVNVDEPIGSGFIVEENENNNVYTGIITVYAPLINLNVSGNDFDVSPNPPVAGSSMDLITTVLNNGEADVIFGSPIEVDFVLDENGNQTTFTETYTGGLNVGASATLTKTIVTPAFGSNSYTVKVDPNGLKTESNEFDNSATVPLCQDFYLRDIPYPVPGYIDFWVSPIIQGTTVLLKIYLQNLGVFNASSIETQFFVNGNFAGTETAASVPKFSGQVIGSSVSYTFATPGTYTVSWQTDFPDDFVECDEVNNTFSTTVTVIPVLPDLFTKSAYISPSELNPDPGESITIALSYDNIGQLNSDSVTVKLLLDDLQVGNTLKVPGLKANEDTTVTDASWVWSSNLVGTHVIRGLVDFTNEITELSETNNEASRTLPVGESANLFFASITFSDSLPSINDVLTITVEIANSGDLDCNADLKFYYVNDLQDTLLFGSVNKITVLENDTLTASINWTVLDSVTTIIGKIVNSNPSETTYTDNEFSKQLGSAPFATIQILPSTFTKDFNVGDAPVTDTLFIENQGTGSLTYTVTSLANFVSESKGNGTIVSSGADTVFVTFGNSTLDVGTHSASVIISSNATNSPTVSIPVTLTYHGSKINAASLVNFGTVFNGTSNSQTLTVSNLGDTDLNVSSIDLPVSGNFTADTSNFTVPALGSQVVSLTWKPQSEGTILQTLTIHSDDFNDPNTSVSVSGNSIPPAYYHNFDYTTTFPPGWSTNASAGDNLWILIDEPLSSIPGDKAMWIEGSSFAPNSPKGQTQISADVNASFESPLYDFSTFSTVKIMYYTNYIAGFESPPEGGYVEISTDGGTTYPNVVAYYNSSISGNEDFDVSGIAAGQSSIKVRFRYEVTDGQSWTIDDFFIGDTTVLANVAPTQVSSVMDLENSTLTSFEIGWSGSFDIDFASYEVHFAETPDFANTTVWDSSDDPLLSDQNANQTIVLGVFPSVYWVKVRAVDASGNTGNFSNSIQVSMQKLITDFKIAPIGNQMKLTWQEVNNPLLTVTGYNVYRDETPDFIPATSNQIGLSVTDEDVSSAFQWTDPSDVTTLPKESYFYSVTAQGTMVSVNPFASSGNSKLSKKLSAQKGSFKTKAFGKKSKPSASTKWLTNDDRKLRRVRQFEVFEILKARNSGKKKD